MSQKVCAVYIMTNAEHGVLYTGVTSNLAKRVWEHRNQVAPKSFTARYNLSKLVWYETTPNILAAIAREKQIKAGPRRVKIALIEAMNPQWSDLGARLFGPAGESP